MTPAILVVDDEPTLRDLMTDILIDEGYLVRSAPDGVAALELHASAPADVIVSDIMMPRLDGFGLVRVLRDRGDLTPMVLMSAAPRPLLPAGIGWVPKPFDIDEVIAMIAQVATLP